MRVCAVVCVLLLHVMSAYVLPEDVDFYLIGFGLIAFGGPAVHTSFIHLSNLFPTQKPLIISLFNGVFSLSGYVYLLFRVRTTCHVLLRCVTMQWSI